MQQGQFYIVSMLHHLDTNFQSRMNSGPWSYEEVYILNSIPVMQEDGFGAAQSR